MRYRHLLGAALIAGLSAGAYGQQKPTASAQQLFDAADALDAKEDWAAAKVAWERLEQAVTRNKRTRAIARARKGNALFRLGGQEDEAVAALRAALADLPTDDPTLREDRHQAHLVLGRVAEVSLDYSTAVSEYAAAEALAASPGQKLGALAGLTATQTFIDPAAAAGALDRADAALASTKVDSAVSALFARRRALLLLNRGDFAGARMHAERAVKLLGGLTERVNLDDISARGDAALAMLLGGAAEDARKYMAYTGAGRLLSGFGPAAEFEIPDCGGEAGLKPTDVAVVEFTIGDDGQIKSATPIYAAGGPGTGLEFARAVREWSWTPEQVKKLPAFFRNRARMEMRCSTAFERPSVGRFLQGELAAWLAEKSAPMPDETGADAATVARQRAALQAAEAGGADRVVMIPHLYQLATNAVVPREETNALARRALAVASAHGAPATARLAIDLIVRSSSSARTWRESRYRAQLAALAVEPAYARDARARAAISLLLADATEDGGRPQLDAVAKDQALGQDDPLKVGALIRIASLEQAGGKAELARAAFEQSGLSADKCALVDKAPRMLDVKNNSSAFPKEAAYWGFEGWVLTQLDIAADGTVPTARAILAYPPFVFSPAGEKLFKTARYEKTYRPDGGLGCGGLTQRVRFQMPS